MSVAFGWHGHLLLFFIVLNYLLKLWYVADKLSNIESLRPLLLILLHFIVLGAEARFKPEQVCHCRLKIIIWLSGSFLKETLLDNVKDVLGLRARVLHYYLLRYDCYHF